MQQWTHKWEQLIRRLLSYCPDADQELLDHLAVFVKDTGSSPACLGVADTVVRLRLDEVSIVAACVALEPPESVVRISADRLPGRDVPAIVEGVRRIDHVLSRAKARLQTEDIRRMVLAIARDIRILLVQLALVLQRLRDLSRLAPADARADSSRLASEALDVYAPIAHRLGIYWIKNELEDLAFQISRPDTYRWVQQECAARIVGGSDGVHQVVVLLKKKLRKYGIEGSVYGREKHLYSVWGKLQRKGVTMDDLYDLVAYRILVKRKSDCYRVLGMLHNEFRPIPGRFKDYIALPKSNGYQSLHTVVFSPFGNRIEVQVRTEKMHAVAESGVAAHWSYKSRDAHGDPTAAGNPTGSGGYAWLQQMLTMHQQVDDPGQFLENIKLDLFPDEIYLFTPAGDIITLPSNATPVDFAYAIHSQVGDCCQGCKVNGRMTPLRTPLKTGDSVEIITGKHPKPNPSWLAFVVTSKARYRIARWQKIQQRDESVAIGRTLLEREIRKSCMTRGPGNHGLLLSEKSLQRAAQELQIADVDDLLFQVGVARLSPLSVVYRMFPELQRPEKSASRPRIPGPDRRYDPEQATPPAEDLMAFSGSEPTHTLPSHVAVRMARCCGPVPGDAIVGIITTGHGITLHTASCPNLASFSHESDRWMRGLGWSKEWRQPYTTRLRVTASNHPGLLTQIGQALVDARAPVRSTQVRDRQKDPCTVLLEIDVQSRAHLDAAIATVRALPAVRDVDRTHG